MSILKLTIYDLNSKNPQSVDDCGFAVLSNIITISSIHLFILQIDVTVVKIRV